MAELNIAALAKEMRCHRNTLYRYQEEGCPIEEGRDAIRDWLAARNQEKSAAKQEVGELQERKLIAECMKLEAEAEAKELKNAVTKGNLWPADETAQALRSAFALAKTRMEDLPLRMVMDFPPDLREYLTGRLEDEVRLVLAELSQSSIGEPGPIEIEE